MRNKSPNIWDNFLMSVREAHLDVWRMLYNLLVLLQDLLELSVLLHYSLVLEANSMLLVLLPARAAAACNCFNLASSSGPHHMKRWCLS